MESAGRKKGFSLVQLLIVAGIASSISSVVFPFLTKGRQDDTIHSSMQNVRQVALAGIMYGGDNNDMMPILVSGPYRSLIDVKDGINTPYGEERTNAWPLTVMPYMKSAQTFKDPTRVDSRNIWSDKAKGVGDDGYDEESNTFRNQSLYPMYGVNYMFCSPGIIPKEKQDSSDAMSYMIGASHGFVEADDPSGTVFYAASKYYGMSSQGYFVVNAPGMWRALGASKAYVTFKNSTPCGADWCYDTDKVKENPQSETNSVYFNSDRLTPTVFLDGHVKIMTDEQLADGTDYMTATPNDGGKAGSNLGGCSIIDKTHYYWNLTDMYYGL
jgi:type II secretory pathway pseudopilin PulG